MVQSCQSFSHSVTQPLHKKTCCIYPKSYMLFHLLFSPPALPLCLSKQVKNCHRVDLTANLKGLNLHCKEESPDMYTSIDAAATALQSKLSKYRQRRSDGHHAGSSMGDDLMAALEAMELDDVVEETADEFVDPEAPNVMKVNSFDLENAIPLKEAIFALDYVDHDFFVFKNEETNKRSVVYKRNAGGIGLIEL